MKSPWLAVFVVIAIAFLPLTQANSDEPDKAPTSAADPMHGKMPGEVRDDNGLKMKLAWCPPGAITMEHVALVNETVEMRNATDDDDLKNKPAPRTRTVITVVPVKAFLTQGCWLGKHEVTQAEWKDVMKSEPWKGHEFTKEGADFAVAYVSWDDAMQFCRKLTDQERLAGRLANGWEYTLPTEAQWERACRARSQTKYSFGDDPSELGEYAWFSDNAWKNRENYAHRVGQKKPNSWGFHDMHGNVWEWCRDYWAEELPGGRDPEVTKEAPTPGAKASTKREGDGPDGTGKGSNRAMRGPGWFNTAPHCGSAARAGRKSTYQSLDIGFRIALSPFRPNK